MNSKYQRNNTFRARTRHVVHGLDYNAQAIKYAERTTGVMVFDEAEKDTVPELLGETIKRGSVRCVAV